MDLSHLAARQHERISTDCEEAEEEIKRLREALVPMEAWVSHALSVMKDRRLVSLDQIEDGDAILTMAREALK